MPSDASPRSLPPYAQTAWGLAVVVSALVTWRMAQPPRAPVVDRVPPPLPRPPTGAERAAVDAMGQELSQAIARATVRHGAPLAASELEGSDASGTPWLPSGVPDNPLTPAVAWVWEGCGEQVVPVPSPDWLLCSTDGTLRAGGMEGAPSWSTLALTEAEPPSPQGNGNP